MEAGVIQDKTLEEESVIQDKTLEEESVIQDKTLEEESVIQDKSLEEVGVIQDKSLEEEDEIQYKSALYKMRKIKSGKRGFSPDSKEKWKAYLNQLEHEIQQSCRNEMTDPAKVMDVTEEYDIVARLLNLPEKISPPRELYAESSTETLLTLPLNATSALQVRPSMKSLKSSDLGVGDSFILGSMSEAYSSNADLASRVGSKTVLGETKSYGDLSIRSKTSDYNVEDDDLFVNPPTPPPEKDLEPWVDKRSPYQKFFTLAEYKATRWRRGFSESKPLELLTVQEKEEHLYNSIASDFCQWVNDCQFKNVQLDETTVTELFQVGMETPAVKAMCVETKELPIVPAQVAQIFNMPEKSEMSGLRRQVRWDIKYAKMKEKGIVDKPRWKCAKGKADERSYRATKTEKPKSTETLDRWFSTTLLSKEEKTGQNLWAHLEKTKVFKHFCNWMMDHEKFKKPHYLEKKGYFKSKYHIDESDMVKVVRMESESTPIESTVASARNNLEGMVAADSSYGLILEDLLTDIPTLKSFVGFDVMAKKAKLPKDKKKKGEESALKPLMEGIRDEGPDSNVHYLALINHPEWP